MSGIRDKRRGVVGLVLLGAVVLIFVFLVGKRVWDANQDDNLDLDVEQSVVEEEDGST